MKNDKEVVVTAVQQNGLALNYASESMKNDKEVVLTAVQQNGLGLDYASESIRTTRRSC